MKYLQVSSMREEQAQLGNAILISIILQTSGK